MQTFLIVIHLMVVVALIISVLLQRSEGGALGIGGGGSFFSSRGQASALTRATAILGAMFFATSISLSIVATMNRASTSIVPAAPTAPAGQSAPTGGLMDEFNQKLDRKPDAAPAPTGPVVPRPR